MVIPCTFTFPETVGLCTLPDMTLISAAKGCQDGSGKYCRRPHIGPYSRPWTQRAMSLHARGSLSVRYRIRDTCPTSILRVLPTVQRCERQRTILCLFGAADPPATGHCAVRPVRKRPAQARSSRCRLQEGAPIPTPRRSRSPSNLFPALKRCVPAAHGSHATLCHRS